MLFLCAWKCLIINKKHFWQLKILNVAIQPKYERVARPGNTSEFYFHFHIHTLEADYQRNKVGGSFEPDYYADFYDSFHVGYFWISTQISCAGPVETFHILDHIGDH